MQDNLEPSQSPTPNPTPKKSKLGMEKIALPLIAIILIMGAVTIFLNSQTKTPTKPPITSEKQTPTADISPLAQSALSLLPNPLTLDASGNGTIDVNIETGGNEVTAVQLELQFDTKAINNVAIKPGPFFTSAVELMKRIDKENGRITYMIGISPAQSPISGGGTVAQITFSKVRNTTLPSTEINFSTTENSKSIVTATGIEESVLKSTTDTVIELKK